MAMHQNRTWLLMIPFAAITLLEILGDVTHTQWLHYGCKPLIMGLLLLHVGWQHGPPTQHAPIRWLLIGMVFALLGDVLLMIQGRDLFAPGLGAFLVMQICYSVAFVQSIRRQRHTPTGRSVVLKAIPFLLYVLCFLFVLRPIFASTPTLNGLWWPVVLYACCLGTMGTFATLRQGLPQASQVIMGALLFIFSDSVIAVDKFVTAVPAASWLIMTTYAAAQYLIVTGMTQAMATPPESGLSIG